MTARRSFECSLFAWHMAREQLSIRPRAAPRAPSVATLVAFVALCACRGRPSGEIPEEAVARPHRERLVNTTLYTVEVGNTRARLCIVLHGGPGLDHTYLRPWLDEVGAYARVRYVDVRGHGRSSRPADANGYSIMAAARDLSDLIQRLQGAEPADIVAHDFGAAVALQLAARHPERVRRVVLVAPLRDAAQIRTIADRSRSALGARGWSRVTELTTPQGTLRDPRQVGELFRRLGRMWWARPPSERVLARLTRDMTYRPEADEHFLVAASMFDAMLLAPEVRAPVLVIAGAGDLTFPARESRALGDGLPHGSYVEIPGAGHCPFIEQNAQTLREIRRFLTSP